MWGFDPEFVVRAGDFISVKPWNAARRLFTSLRLIPGKNVRLRTIPNQGTVINFDGDDVSFIGPFHVSLQSTEKDGPGAAVVTPGFIDTSVMPTTTVDGNDVSLDDDSDPIFGWQVTRVGADGRGYVALECELDEKDDSIVAAYLVQVADLNTDDGDADPNSTIKDQGGTVQLGPASKNGKPRVRWPIAIIRLSGTGDFSCYQYVSSNLQHRSGPASSGTTSAPRRHFFYPT